ncbi:MAG TPA: Crp/Fnr family transcriptional regulator [Pseudomonadales bacterium]|jgi:CRP-like cAMP-binding protein|nr:Crp/Fnr family transcriptional regulator [Pseudomonadales bacterium]
MAIQQQTTGLERQQNRLLLGLPANDHVRWLLHLESVELQCDQLLCESTTEYLYFPTSAIVSLLYVTEGGESTEIAVIGNDGAVGMSIFMNGNTQPIQAKVQSAGHAYRVRGHVVRDEARRGGPMLDILSRHAQAMNAQVAQTAVCNRHHSIDQQLCRRLLIGLDRSRSDELVMSHQLAASLLGVRRESVTVAARRLQDAGIIRYSRGHIAVLDRQQLEKRACECYAALQREYDRLLPRRLPPATPNASTRPVPCGSPETHATVTRRSLRDPSLLFCRI